MFPLGSGDVPETATDLEARLARGIQAVLHPTAGQVRVRGRLDERPDGDAGVEAHPIARLEVDLTGVELCVQASTDQPAPAGAGTSTRVHHLSMTAAPVLVQDLPVNANAEVHNLPVRYRPRADGQWWLEVAEGDDHRASGHAEVIAAIADIERVVTTEAETRVAAAGFTLTKLELNVVAAGPRSAEVTVEASLRRGILRAGVTGSATARLGTDMVVTISGLGLTSSSPLVGMALPSLRGRLARWEGHRIDLSRLTVGGATVQDVALTVTETTVGVRAELGAGTAPS